MSGHGEAQLETKAMLFADRCPVPNPGEIRVGRGSITVIMVVRGVGLNGAVIAPPVVLRMTVGKGNHATPVMRTVGKIKKIILIHVHSEIGPADTVRIYIREGKNSRGSG